ncbi:MAG: hypothetical protein HQK74_07450, partial [Desulfamplus sp.]|nr:hypothetical protein [Desulfamplus sp.]
MGRNEDEAREAEIKAEEKGQDGDKGQEPTLKAQEQSINTKDQKPKIREKKMKSKEQEDIEDDEISVKAKVKQK